MRRNLLITLSLGTSIALAGCKNMGEHEEKVALSDVPTTVRSAFDSAHPNATVNKVEKEKHHDKDVYEFKYTDSNGKKGSAEYDTMGMPVKD